MTRALLDITRIQRPAERDAILARAAASIEVIEAASPLTWVPMSEHMRLSESIFVTLGADRGTAVWRDAMGEALQRPLLRGFIKMSTDLFGMSPSTFFRQANRIYPHMTRHLGQLRVEPDAEASSAGRLTLRAFPPNRYDFRWYVEGLRGCIDSVFVACGVTGAAVVDERDDARGVARYSVRWAPRPMR